MGDIQWKNPKVTIEKIAESTVREVVSEREEKVTSHEIVPLWALKQWRSYIFQKSTVYGKK